MPPPPSDSLLPNRDNLNETPPPEAQTNIADNLASDFGSTTQPPTFEHIIKSMNQSIKPTTDLHLYPNNADLQKNLQAHNESFLVFRGKIA